MREVLAKGATFQFCATGWSMTPFIKDGDLISVAPLTNERVAIGSIVAYIQPATGHLIVHRVIGRQRATYLIQGDNTIARHDDVVQLKDILGRVTRVERKGRRVPLGLGPERWLVAMLSRNGLLVKAIGRLRALKGFLFHLK